MTEEKEKDQNHEVEDKQKDFALVTKAFRTPRGGITERLVCQDLFQGTFTDDKSKKINHLCSAAMCCGDLMKGEKGDSGEKLELPFDPELIQGIFAVNASFDGAEPFKLDQQGNVLICIPFAFIENKENYQRFISPWANGLVPHYYQGQYWRGKTKHMVKLYHGGWSRCDLIFGYCEEGQEEEETKKIVAQYASKSCPQCCSRVNSGSVRTETVVMPDDSVPSEFFYGFTKSLGKMSARQYRACFYAWAIPILERAKMAMSSYVSPQTYEDVARLLSGAKENGDSTAARTDKLQD
jgi:hypothetical protein